MPLVDSFIFPEILNPKPMNLKSYVSVVSVMICLATPSSQAVTLMDSLGDIDGSISTGSGTLDIVGMEVTNNASDIVFALTVNGDISTTDWGNFMIGVSTGSTAATNTGNGWARPIELNSPLGGMDYWVGTWVNGGGGAQLWNYTPGTGTGGTGNNWSNIATAGPSLVPGVSSSISFTTSLTSLGLSVGDTIYFDAYSSGGGGGDSAVDALSNPNISITAWGQSYTSSTIGSGGVGLSSYTLVPEPSSLALLGLGGILIAAYRSRHHKPF